MFKHLNLYHLYDEWVSSVTLYKNFLAIIVVKKLILKSNLLDTRIIYIKNMVCARCIMAVNDIFKRNDIKPEHIELGEVKLKEPIEESLMHAIDQELEAIGFERINDRKSQLLEKIKRVIREEINAEEPSKYNWSTLLSEKLNYDYSHLSSLFSSVEGITLEQYIIRQKVEKVKEYLAYDELSLKEISYRLGYSSVAHLSGQFKKITGMTPSDFKADFSKRRTSLDKLT